MKNFLGCDAYALSNALNISISTAYRLIDNPGKLTITQLLTLCDCIGVSIQTAINAVETSGCMTLKEVEL